MDSYPILSIKTATVHYEFSIPASRRERNLPGEGAPSGLASEGALAHRHAMTWAKTPLGRLRAIGFAEGTSFLILLLVAMPLKYLAHRPGAVRAVGMAHGILFLLYVAAALQTAKALRWPKRRTALVLLASVLPGGPFVAEAKLLRAEA